MRIATLFSGIGSPEQAAKRVYKYNHKLVFACEWDKYARESFKANYKIDDEHFYKDINDMCGLKYKNEVDILIGGSPCQDFSLAGLRSGIDGQKGILIYQYIRIIKEVEPPIFIYENVKGMLSDKKGKTIKDFVQAFREMGYFCHYEVLNTKDYGVPQNRERIFLVGFKDKEHYYNFSFAPKIKSKKIETILEKKQKIKHTTQIGNSKTFGNCINYEKIAFCLRCGHPSGYTNNNNETKKFTPRECFRLQDFPDTFKFIVSNTQLYKQAGNSISVNVIEMIFNQIELSRYKNTNGGLF